MAEPDQLAELIRRARSGDREAYQELIAPYIDPAYKLAFTILRQRHDAEDAVQESVLKGWTKLSQLRDGTTLKAWFFQIVVNESRMGRRGRWRSVVKLPEPPAFDGKSEDDIIQTTDLRQALAKLSEAERMVLFLYFELDLDFPQIGRILGLSPAGAKTRVYRAVRRLRPALGEGEEPVI